MLPQSLIGLLRGEISFSTRFFKGAPAFTVLGPIYQTNRSPMLLNGKVAVVTGGAQGIGRAYCHRFAREGAAVGIIDLRDSQAKEVEREINKMGAQAVAISADVTSEAAMAQAAKQIAQRFGRIDVLMNNAAIYYDLEMGNTTLDYLRKVLEVNLIGVIVCSRAVFPYMKAQRSGSIINISSTGAYMFPSSGPNAPDLETIPLSPYGLSKFGVIYVTKFMARLVGRYNIRINAIAPGATLSEATRKHKKIGEGPAPAEVVSDTALYRALEPSDLTGLATFLASDDSALMTGQTLVCDAGRILLG